MNRRAFLVLPVATLAKAPGPRLPSAEQALAEMRGEYEAMRDELWSGGRAFIQQELTARQLAIVQEIASGPVVPSPLPLGDLIFAPRRSQS
jgi:hypothetical protein